MSTLKLAAVDGLVLFALPTYVALAEVQAGQSERVLPDWRAGKPQIVLIMPSRQGLPPVVEAFAGYLRQALPAAIKD